MSIYSYKDNCPIDQVAFRTTANGSVRAYLHAREGTECGTLEPLRKVLKSKEWNYIPCAIDGIPALEVRGFGYESELITALNQQAMVKGKPDIQKSEQQATSWGDYIKKRSMQIGGLFMSTSDAFFLGYGIKGKSWENALAGISYFGGSATWGLYGRNDQSNFQIRKMAQQLVDYAKEHGLSVPEDSSANLITKERPQSALRKVENLFREYPAEIGNMLTALAGVFVAKGAFKHIKHGVHADMTPKQIKDTKFAGWMDVGLGTCTLIAGLLATFVKEKAHDPDAPKTHGIEAFKEWIQESPQRAASYLYLISTGFHTFSTFSDRRKNKKIIADPTSSVSLKAKASEELKAIKWRTMFIIGTITGEILLSISSKGHGEGVTSDETVAASVIAVAAELIAKQPASMQEELIQGIGAYLGQPDILALKDDSLVEKLRAQVHALQSNPWLDTTSKTQEPATTAATSSNEPPATIAMKPENAAPAWKRKHITFKDTPVAQPVTLGLAG